MELIPGLPNHIALECLIRISFDQFPKAASVCRAWNAIIKHPNFIQRWKAFAGWQIAVHYKRRVYRFQMHSPSLEYLRNQIKTRLPDIDINDLEITYRDWNGRNVIVACDGDLAYRFQCLGAVRQYHIELTLIKKALYDYVPPMLNMGNQRNGEHDWLVERATMVAMLKDNLSRTQNIMNEELVFVSSPTGNK
nr:F-box/kelch-repeat protein At1g80440-like [Ipomoea batatas]